MSVHRVFLDSPAELATGPLRITGEEAHHALRVKRLEAGDALEVLDGCGRVGHGRLTGSGKVGKTGWHLEVEIARVVTAPRVIPEIHVRSAIPKGPRVGEMIESLSQVGAASWGPLVSVRGPLEAGEHKLDRLRRIAAESAKQCGRAWPLEVVDAVSVATVVAQARNKAASSEAPLVIMAVAAGDKVASVNLGPSAIVLIGPEGGWERREIDEATAAAVRVASFGPHVMRIEVAGAVAVTRLLAAAGV